MTAPHSTTTTTSSSSSRRALLVGALGGIGTWVAAAIGRTNPTNAAEGDGVHVGDELIGTSVTKIENATLAQTGIWGVCNGAGTGVVGSANGTGGTGVHGYTGWRA